MQPEQRTLQQNKALHKWLDQLCDVLNESGYDMKTVLKPEIDIPWTRDSAKNYLWRPIQEIMIDVESTADCTTVKVVAIPVNLLNPVSYKGLSFLTN